MMHGQKNIKFCIWLLLCFITTPQKQIAMAKAAPYSSKFDIKFRKNLIGCYTWSIAL